MNAPLTLHPPATNFAAPATRCAECGDPLHDDGTCHECRLDRAETACQRASATVDAVIAQLREARDEALASDESEARRLGNLIGEVIGARLSLETAKAALGKVVV